MCSDKSWRLVPPMFLLSILFLMCAPGPLYASAALVQSATSSLVTGNVSQAFSSNNAAGNVIVFGVRYEGDNSISTVSDTRGNTYSAIGSAATGNTSSDGALALYYATGIASGANTVSVTFASSTANSQLLIAEISGLAASPLDKNAFAVNSSGSTSLSSGNTATTTQAGEYLVGAGTSVGGNVTTWTAGTSYTLEKSGSRIAYEDRSVIATGAYGATFTISPSLKWVCGVATFKTAAAAATRRNLTALGAG